MKIQQPMKHLNNFDFLRFVFAFAVVLSHIIILAVPEFGASIPFLYLGAEDFEATMFVMLHHFEHRQAVAEHLLLVAITTLSDHLCHKAIQVAAKRHLFHNGKGKNFFYKRSSVLLRTSIQEPMTPSRSPSLERRTSV